MNRGLLHQTSQTQKTQQLFHHSKLQKKKQKQQITEDKEMLRCEQLETAAAIIKQEASASSDCMSKILTPLASKSKNINRRMNSR
ncbi:unnamed protein product [Chironomus riparius]|uniref:Uncharacterized protein n=1 Tax=Chironomus riparius TaxID=315576 RepID=A0A9N9RUX5_9DIPT|nr:unnamed protein product [Chironomus riparius]